jgi:hypothetical protein
VTILASATWTAAPSCDDAEIASIGAWIAGELRAREEAAGVESPRIAAGSAPRPAEAAEVGFRTCCRPRKA